jgi:hypothetical protein
LEEFDYRLELWQCGQFEWPTIYLHFKRSRLGGMHNCLVSLFYLKLILSFSLKQKVFGTLENTTQTWS